MRYLSPTENQRVEKAIIYMVKNMEATGINPKPVIFHSVKVAMAALNAGLSINAVIAGVLHDLVEDTDCTINDIIDEFGPEIGRIVEHMTLRNETLMKDYRDKDYLKRWGNYFKSVMPDEESFLLKLIDTKENFVYNDLVEDKQRGEMIKKRTMILFDLAENNFKDDKRYQKIIEIFS